MSVRMVGRADDCAASESQKGLCSFVGSNPTPSFLFLMDGDQSALEPAPKTGSAPVA